MESDKCFVTMYKSDTYSVSLTEFADGIKKLSILRKDRQPIRDWSEIQKIKNEILGEETYAIEVFPPKSELINRYNCYHLFHIPALDLKAYDLKNKIITSPKLDYE
jgi:hypothetical protein